MTRTIRWKLGLILPDNSTTSVLGRLEVEAYERTRIVMHEGDQDKVVDLAQGCRLLVVTADRVPENENLPAPLSLKVNGAGEALELRSPLILLGRGALLRFAGAELTNLSFTTSVDQDVVVDILTARDATPPAPNP